MRSRHKVDLEESVSIKVPVDAKIGDLSDSFRKDEIWQIPCCGVVFYVRADKELIGSVEIFDGFRVANHPSISYGIAMLSRKTVTLGAFVSRLFTSG